MAQLLPLVQAQQLPEVYPAGTSEYQEAVGRWGEELVWRHLSLVYSSHPSHQGWAMEWVNKEQEQGLPYDIRIRPPASDTRGQELYIEVKASSSERKDFFEVSHAEMAFAEAQGAAFHLYRVLGIGGRAPAVARVVDPVGKWAAGALPVCLVVAAGAPTGGGSSTGGPG